MGTPTLGLFGINMIDDPALMMAVAQRAEALGYDSVWTGEHIVLPDPREAPSPASPRTHMADTAASLSYLAAGTSTIRLGSGIVILPQRRPAVLAKSLATLDHLSGGRLMFGLGVGYIPREFAACDTPMSARGARTDAYLDAMRALWTDDAVTISNEYVEFDRVTANPKPAQADVHTVVGGHSRAAARRAVAKAHGWYGFNLDFEATESAIGVLRSAAAEVDRPAGFGTLEVSVTPPTAPSPSDLEALAELGVDRVIILLPVREGEGAIMDFLEVNAPGSP